MMTTIIKVLAIVLLILGCSEQSIAQSKYQDMLQRLEKERACFAEQHWSNVKFSSTSNLLSHTLADSIFPTWYGTPWDFNGTSNVPGEGKIACGYFVTTTLKHAGFNLNRYKLAQQDATTIVKRICSSRLTRRFESKDDVYDFLKKKKDGVFIVGLDNHVGFIVVEMGEYFFVHSDYINNKVVREKADSSLAFTYSNVYVIGSLTHNPASIHFWLDSTKIY